MDLRKLLIELGCSSHLTAVGHAASTTLQTSSCVNASSLFTAPRFDLRLATQETTSGISPPVFFDRISAAGGLRRQHDHWENLKPVS